MAELVPPLPKPGGSHDETGLDATDSAVYKRFIALNAGDQFERPRLIGFRKDRDERNATRLRTLEADAARLEADAARTEVSIGEVCRSIYATGCVSDKFTGSQRGVRALCRIIVLVGGLVLAVNLLLLHRIAVELLGVTSVLFATAAWLQWLANRKVGENCSCSTFCGAFIDAFLAVCTILLMLFVWMVADTSASWLHTVVYGFAAWIIYMAVWQGVRGVADDVDEHPVRLTMV